jgi:hypothetical protein
LWHQIAWSRFRKKLPTNPIATMLKNELACSEISEHIGSCLDDFLENEDLLAETEAAAAKRVITWQIEQSSFPTC